MAQPVASVPVTEANGASAQAAISSLPGLQLLLRILPFRSSHNLQQLQQQVQKLPRHKALEELHRHPLWRLGGTAAQWPEPRLLSSAPLAPAEAESALLAYVRLAAEADQHAAGRRVRSRNPLSAADIAAELHALYSLAAIHVTQQQDPSHAGEGSSSSSSSNSNSNSSWHHSKHSLSDGDIMQLLKAYASLEDRGQSSSHKEATQHEQRGDEAWDSRSAAAAAAMEALWAFASLADAQQQDGQQPQQQQQQQQQPSGQAPGKLQQQAGSSEPCGAHKQADSCSSARSSINSSTYSSARNSCTSASRSPSNDLQVLLKLAQLGLQPAT